MILDCRGDALLGTSPYGFVPSRTKATISHHRNATNDKEGSNEKSLFHHAPFYGRSLSRQHSPEDKPANNILKTRPLHRNPTPSLSCCRKRERSGGWRQSAAGQC